MKLKLKDDRIFRNTVDGVAVEIGGGSVEVDDKIAQYLLKHFPAMVEKDERKAGKPQKEE